ncbi:hypothetical protein [Chamaesiphon minutus]|uniref:Uncharacterized protein n=1 Tax=Chamaesiphon minutus (strain ATCC 27169 / PCC 6605) TaxID=1173020 RepID=K9UPF4_CHAP6|nr:hypothetical protein [Chamaesiphon minutus]AFY96281.1 hypothetical protein Cha6605_5394 [Chamaesiphon minutus PCC 6605]
MSFNSQPDRDHISVAEAELMDCLLSSSTVNYPWNPADPETAEYYTRSDNDFSLDDWSDAEIGQKSQSFFASIQSCWGTVSEEARVNPLAALTSKFGARVPQQWLAQIAANVSNLAPAGNLEPVEQLVQSVRGLLSNWEVDDLLVMARPYAYAMRCNPGVDDPDNIVRPLEWAELSELERAKLTILVAQYAIDSSNCD